MPREEDPRPPQPPDFDRAFAPAWNQIVGIALLIALIVVALAGVFGPTTGEVAAANGDVALTVDYPVRWRSKASHTVAVEVTNTSARVLPRVEVAFDRSYFETYAATRFEPDLAYVTDEAFVIELRDVRAGETRLVTTEIAARAYGSRSGTVAASNEDATARVQVQSIVFP